MNTTPNMKASIMKSVLLALALIATVSTAVHAQTYRPATNTKLILNSTYPSGNALTLQTGAGQTAYTLTLPASAPTAGYVLQSDPSSANTLIWTSPLGLYDFQNGLTESGSNTVKWGGDLTGATTINTADFALSFVNNGSGSSALTIGGGTATLTLDVLGATTINTSGSAATSIGNSSATFTLVSSTGLNVTATGEISDGDGNVLVADNIEPTVNDNYSLGTNTARWSDVYVGPSTVHIGSTSIGGDELALSYNTTTNTANINVGNVNTVQITSTLVTGTVPVSITNNTSSTTSTTGALKVTGGVGIAENINVGGTASVTGDLAVNTNKFTVAAISGNTAVAGILDVTGATTLYSTLDVTGATTVTGATSLNGGLTMDTDKFTVADGTGNTAIAGTLNVDGATTLNSTVINTLSSGAGSYLTLGSGTFEMYYQSGTALTDDKSSLTFGTGGTPDGKVVIASRKSSLANTTELVLDNGTAKIGNNTFNTYVDQDGTNGYVQIIADLNYVKVDRTNVTVEGPTTLNSTLTVTDATTLNGNVTIGSDASDVITAYLPNDGTSSHSIVVADGANVLRMASVATIIGDNAWSVGGNSFTGGGATRVLGITSTNGDDLVIKTENTDRLTITSAGAATFAGALTSTGDFAVGANTFTVAAATGNTAVAGTLDITGAATVTGATALNGGLTMDTDKFTVADATGNTSIGGTLAVTDATTLSSTLGVTGATALDGGLTMDTDKFTVADGSGNTTIAGTLDVTGVTTLATTTIDALSSGAGSYLTLGSGIFDMYRQEGSGASDDKSSLTFGSGASADGKVVLASRKTSANNTISLTLDNGTATMGSTVFNTYVDRDPVTGYVQIIADFNAVKVDLNGITADGPTTVSNTLAVTGVTTFSSGMNVPITVQAAAYTATDADYIIIQSADADVTLPAGVNGRVYVIKNTTNPAADIDVIADGTETFEDATGTLTVAGGATVKLVYEETTTTWYQVGN